MRAAGRASTRDSRLRLISFGAREDYSRGGGADIGVYAAKDGDALHDALDGLYAAAFSAIEAHYAITLIAAMPPIDSPRRHHDVHRYAASHAGKERRAFERASLRGQQK